MWHARRLRPRVRSCLLPVVFAYAAFLSASPVSASVAPPGCPRQVDAVFWGGAQQFVLGQALAANLSPCVEYYVTAPPLVSDRTMLAFPARFNELRALSPQIHPVAEIRWTSDNGWRAWVVGGHPQWMPGRTFYEAGQTARRRMAARGLDVAAGETWAFNELTPEVLAGEPGARAEVLEFLRGLYDGDPGMPKARGIVFNIWVPSTTDAAEVAAYKTRLRTWLTDEAFWSELDRYVDVFAHEVYVSALSWGVSGAPLGERAKRLNEYFQHMAVLADDAPKSVQAARNFLHRTYLPLANAAWPHFGIGDTHLLSPDLMSQFVSAQVYALRRFAEAYPGIVPQHLIGFGWAPIMQFPGYTPEGRDQIAARLASAIRVSTGELPSSFKDACGPRGERTLCEGDVPGAEFATAWSIFDSWE
jgi:hypothetical protein